VAPGHALRVDAQLAGGLPADDEGSGSELEEPPLDGRRQAQEHEVAPSAGGGAGGGPLRRRGDAGAWGWALTGFLAAMAMLTGLALLLV
jgi:hypothetical protein